MREEVEVFFSFREIAAANAISRKGEKKREKQERIVPLFSPFRASPRLFDRIIETS